VDDLLATGGTIEATVKLIRRLGGGLSNFPAITTQLADRLPRHLLPVARVPRIERARHGDAGGMRGAAFLHLTD
ncbi:N-acetylglucosamine kinase, partial [Escherichia sp. TWPC-MK]